MKLQFEALVSQIHGEVRLSDSYKYRNVIVKWEDQYYSVRCMKSMLGKVKKLRIGQRVVVTANTFSQSKYNPNTANTNYTILLIAEEIRPLGYTSIETCTCGFPLTKEIQNGEAVKYCASCG